MGHSYWTWPSRNTEFPIKSVVIFHGYVSLPEGASKIQGSLWVSHLSRHSDIWTLREKTSETFRKSHGFVWKLGELKILYFANATFFPSNRATTPSFCRETHIPLPESMEGSGANDSSLRVSLIGNHRAFASLLCASYYWGLPHDWTNPKSSELVNRRSNQSDKMI